MGPWVAVAQSAAQQITLGPTNEKKLFGNRPAARAPGTAMGRSTSGGSSAGPQATSKNAFEYVGAAPPLCAAATTRCALTTGGGS